MTSFSDPKNRKAMLMSRINTFNPEMMNFIEFRNFLKKKVPAIIAKGNMMAIVPD